MHILSLNNLLDVLIMMNINICNHYLACLKQQRNLAFLSCKSVGVFPQVFLGPLRIVFYLTVKEVNRFNHYNLFWPA